MTTIRHPDNSSSYKRVGHLLDVSLRSVCRQTDGDFRVVVVHNVRADHDIRDPRITYVTVDFPAPSPERSPRIEFSLFKHDKGTKCVIGALAAQELGADHVMFFDADDLVHHGLAAFANERPHHPGWYAPQGWIHTHGLRTVQLMATDFHHKNGSTSIIRTDLLRLDPRLTTSSSQQEIGDAIGLDRVHRMFGEHGWWQDEALESGQTMEELPFPIAVWEIGTGENLSGNIVSNRDRQPISGEVTECFGLTTPSWPTHLSTMATSSAARVWRRASTILRRVKRSNTET